jgi:hypothetical protein
MDDDSASLFERLQSAAPTVSSFAAPENTNPQLSLF